MDAAEQASPLPSPGQASCLLENWLQTATRTPAGLLRFSDPALWCPRSLSCTSRVTTPAPSMIRPIGARCVRWVPPGSSQGLRERQGPGSRC